jgi:hypothetical protein
MGMLNAVSICWTDATTSVKALEQDRQRHHGLAHMPKHASPKPPMPPTLSSSLVNNRRLVSRGNVYCTAVAPAPQLHASM